MRFNRADYFGNDVSEIMNKYKENLSRNSKPVNIQELIASRFYDPKIAVEEYLDSFRERTGIKDYLKEINAELENGGNEKTAKYSPDSLVDIPEIKESIDEALNKKQFERAVDFLNKLQDAVANDIRVPEDLKGVTMDAKLVDYIRSRIGNSDEEDVDYSNSLSETEVSDFNKDQKNMSYFDFDSTRKENEYT